MGGKTESELPEPPKFSVNDLPEPPSLKEKEVPALTKKKKEISAPEPSSALLGDNSHHDIIPPPPGFKENKIHKIDPPKLDVPKEPTLNEPQLEDIKHLKEQVKGTKEEKPRKKSFFSKIFKKKEEKTQIPTLPKQQESVNLNVLSDDAFRPPGSAPKEKETEFIQEEKTVEDKPDWYEEGASFRENEMLTEAEKYKEDEMLDEAKEHLAKTPLTQVKGIGKKNAQKLKKAGIKTAEHLADHSHHEVTKKAKIPKLHAKKIVSNAKKIKKLRQEIDKPKVEKKEISEIIKELEQEKKSIEKLKRLPIKEDVLLNIEGHKDLIKVLQQLEKKRKDLVDMEQKLADKEIKLSTHDDTYKRDLQHVEKLKRRLDHDIRERTQYLINMEKEYFEKAQNLTKRQAHVEINQKALDEKENTLKGLEVQLKKKLNDLEDRELTIETKEKKFDKIMDDLEEEDAQLKEKEEDLLKREEEYTQRLDALETHEKSVVDTLKDKRGRLDRQEKDIKVREKNIRHKEKNIDKRKISMEYAKDIMEKQKGKLIDDQFDQYLREQIGLIKGMGVSDMKMIKNMPTPDIKPSSKIHELAEKCKDLLNDNRVTEAKIYYNQLRQVYYDSEFHSDKEKEQVHNLVRSLYDEINLADIGRNR